MPAHTTHFGLPYPLPDDPVVDYPALGSELASKLDLYLGMVVPIRTVLYAAGSGSYAPPAGALALLVELIGAGGGAPAIAINPTNAGVGGGGGGGAYSAKLIPGPLLASYPYVVAAGGAAAANTKAGLTSFGAGPIAAADGGTSGGANSGAGFGHFSGGIGGVAGAPSVGDLTLPGDDAGDAFTFTPTQVIGSRGGAAARGAGQQRQPPGTGNFAGIVGKNPGGGAAGPTVATSGTMAGAVGGNGLILVTAWAPPAALLALAEARDALEELPFGDVLEEFVPAEPEEPAPPVELP